MGNGGEWHIEFFPPRHCVFFWLGLSDQGWVWECGKAVGHTHTERDRDRDRDRLSMIISDEMR
jgi:hypothetical protein